MPDNKIKTPSCGGNHSDFLTCSVEKGLCGPVMLVIFV